MTRFLLQIVVCCVTSFSILDAQTQSFRFAWLSDTHIGSSTAAEDLRAAVHDINAMSNIAFVILSGDITELGWNAELYLAKQILDSLNKPYYICPGNHDTKWSESGCTRFSQLWGTDRFVFEYAGYRFVGLHEGPIMRMGDGHFAPEDLRWVDSVLAALPDGRQPLFFVTHYPLDSGLDNWYEMTERLKRFNIKAVLCGHGHANRVMEFEGIRGIMGRSNLRGRNPVGGYTIAEVRDDSMFVFERMPGSESERRWYAFSFSERIIDTLSHPRPDFSINERYADVKQIWKTETGFTIASAPALWDNSVIAGSSSGSVTRYSLDNGQRIWSYSTDATVYSTPDVAEGRLVFGSSDSNIYCLEARSGKLIWKYLTQAAVVACPRIERGIVFVGGGDGIFRAIDLSTGKLKWAFKNVGAFVETKPLQHNGKVIFGSWDSYLYALNQEDGSIAWKWNNGTSTRNLSPAACWPVAVENKVFIVAPDRTMTAIDVRTGNSLWRTNEHQVRESIGVSNDGTRIYAKCMNDTLFAFSSTAPAARLVWATNCSYGYDIDPSMPVEKDGTVFFGTKNGLVYALDAASGAIRWIHKIGNTVVNTVAPVDGHRVVVTDFDGRIILLDGMQGPE